MSPRNIRAHQARRILAQPTRRGRTAFYDESHVRRLETITMLQRQGFNQTSIEVILGVRGAEPSGESLVALVRRVVSEQPALLNDLLRHGVVARAEDGTVRVVRPRVLRTAIELHRSGMRAVPAVQLLIEVLDRTGRLAEELVQATGDRILSLSGDAVRAAAASVADGDRMATALAQGMIGMLAEAFRVAVENCGHSSLVELVAQRHALDLAIVDGVALDVG
jgi:DNA-binding transcriptional MerR regulator